MDGSSINDSESPIVLEKTEGTEKPVTAFENMDVPKDSGGAIGGPLLESVSDDELVRRIQRLVILNPVRRVELSGFMIDCLSSTNAGLGKVLEVSRFYG